MADEKINAKFDSGDYVNDLWQDMDEADPFVGVEKKKTKEEEFIIKKQEQIAKLNKEIERITNNINERVADGGTVIPRSWYKERGRLRGERQKLENALHAVELRHRLEDLSRVMDDNRAGYDRMYGNEKYTKEDVNAFNRYHEANEESKEIQSALEAIGDVEMPEPEDEVNDDSVNKVDEVEEQADNVDVIVGEDVAGEDISDIEVEPEGDGNDGGEKNEEDENSGLNRFSKREAKDTAPWDNVDVDEMGENIIAETQRVIAESEGEAELDKDVKSIIEQKIGKNALMMSIDTSGSRDSMAKRLASEQIRKEKKKGLVKGIGKNSEGVRFRKLVKEYRNQIDENGDYFVKGEDEVEYDENGNVIGGWHEKVLDEYGNYVDEMMKGDLAEYDTVDGGKIKLNDKGTEQLRQVFDELSFNLMNDKGQFGLDDALEEFDAKIEELKAQGILTENINAANLHGVAKKIFGVAEDLEANAEAFGALNEYLENNVALYTGEANIGIETKTKLNKTAAIMAATGGGALGMAGLYGVGMGIRQLVRKIPIIGSVAGFAGGLAAGIDQVRMGLNQFDVDTAFGRTEDIERRRNNKGILSKIFRTNIERDYDFKMNEVDGTLSDEMAEKLANTSDAQELSEMFNKYLVEKDGSFELGEQLNDNDINELIDLVAMTRARFDVGHEKHRDLITYDIKDDDNMADIQSQRAELTHRLSSAMRLLRVNGYGEDVVNRQEKSEKMIEKQLNVFNVANIINGKGNKGVVRAIVKRVAVGVLIGTTVGASTSYAMEKFGVQDKIEALAERMEINDKINEAQDKVQVLMGRLGIDNGEVSGSGKNVGEVKAAELETTETASGYGDYRDELLGNDKLNAAMDNDNVVYMPEVDKSGNVVANSYRLMDDIADREGQPVDEFFDETGITIKFESDGKTLTSESIEAIKKYYGTDDPIIEGVETPVSEAMATTGGAIEGQNLVENITRIDGAVTTMNASDIRDGGENWIINVWDRGRGAIINDNTRYFFQVGDDRSHTFAYDVDKATGQVVIPKDSLVGKELIKDVDGDGRIDILGSMHGVMEVNNETGEAITQASLPGNNSVTFESLKEEYATAPEVETPLETGDVSYVFRANGKPDITIRSPQQVYSNWEGNREEFLNTHYESQGYSRTIELREDAIRYGGGNALRQVANVGGHNAYADTAYLDGEKIKDIYEGGPLIERVYNDDGNFVREQFDSLDQDKAAIEATQKLFNNISKSARKSEILNAIVNPENGSSTPDMNSINETGSRLEMDDKAFDEHNNSIMKSVFDKLGAGGYRPKLKIMEAGTRNSSEYVARMGAGDGERSIVSSPNMITTEDEPYITFENSEGKNLFDNPESEAAIRKVLKIPKGAVIDEIGYKVKCEQAFARWHIPDNDLNTDIPKPTPEEEVTIVTGGDDVIFDRPQDIERPINIVNNETVTKVTRRKIVNNTTNNVVNTTNTTTAIEQNPNPVPNPEPTPAPTPEPAPTPTSPPNTVIEPNPSPTPSPGGTTVPPVPPGSEGIPLDSKNEMATGFQDDGSGSPNTVQDGVLTMTPEEGNEAAHYNPETNQFELDNQPAPIQTEESNEFSVLQNPENISADGSGRTINEVINQAGTESASGENIATDSNGTMEVMNAAGAEAQEEANMKEIVDSGLDNMSQSERADYATQYADRTPDYENIESYSDDIDASSDMDSEVDLDASEGTTDTIEETADVTFDEGGDGQ